MMGRRTHYTHVLNNASSPEVTSDDGHAPFPSVLPLNLRQGHYRGSLGIFQVVEPCLLKASGKAMAAVEHIIAGEASDDHQC